MKKLLVFACLVFLVSSCAVNRKLTYNEQKTEIKDNSSFTYVVSTHDQRDVIVDGSRDEKFVGYMRSGVGIAYPIGTKSDENFSDVFSEIIVNSFTWEDVENIIKIVKTLYSDSKESIVERMKTKKADRLLLFTINKLRSDSKPMGMWSYGTDYIWDITVDIYDKNGKFLATNTIKGENLGLDKKGSGSIKKTQKTVNREFKSKLDLLLSDKNVKKALLE